MPFVLEGFVYEQERGRLQRLIYSEFAKYSIAIRYPGGFVGDVIDVSTYLDCGEDRELAKKLVTTLEAEGVGRHWTMNQE